MLIDGFTIFAQLVNFLILVWLLKRFLYKPILKAIDERERYIQLQVQEADLKKSNADNELLVYQRMNEAFEQQRQTQMANAVAEVDQERIRLLDLLQNEINSLRLHYLNLLQSENDHLSSEIIRRIQTEVFDIARKALRDLATVGLNEQMVEAFLNKLITLKPTEHDSIASCFVQVQNRVVIRSSFALSPEMEEKVKTVIKSTFWVDPVIKFEVDNLLISGISFSVGGFKVIWSIDEYLVVFKNKLDSLIKEKYDNARMKS